MKHESLAMAEQQLRDTMVTAPQPTKTIPGIEQGGAYAVSQRSVAEGAFVRPGVELFRLVIDQTLKLRVPVPERYSPDVKLGLNANIITAAYSTPFAGVVSRINPTIDPATRTFEVEVRIPNPKRELKPGGFAKASIITQVHSQATTVPLEAVVTFAGIVKIFVIEDGKAKEVQVTLGTQSTKWVEVAKPNLPPGAVVVTSGQSALADGTPVAVRAAK
jgi:RND family efflux transporter MFP subunit